MELFSFWGLRDLGILTQNRGTLENRMGETVERDMEAGVIQWPIDCSSIHQVLVISLYKLIPRPFNVVPFW